MVRLLIALQSAAAVPIAPIDFDLKKAPPPDNGAIVVTGRRLSQRVEREPEETGEPPLGRAEIGLFGKVRANVHVESQSFPNGSTSPRVMTGIKMPF
ncbi:MAG: hypothetical protein QHC40_03770 [Sphingobium sp.]|nr:hypothetical protein [Sphingobium sp.]